MDKVKDTCKSYSFIQKTRSTVVPVGNTHFDHMQEVIDEPIVRGELGIDVGSGCGYDTYVMATSNPSVKIISMDLSEGVYKTKEITNQLNNVRVIRCSVIDLPFKKDIFDFAYSFGVLHHLPIPQDGLKEVVRVVKHNSPLFLYLYEDHSENLIKYIPLQIIAVIRKVTVRMPPKIIYGLCCLFSPLVFLLFSVPAKILAKFKSTEHIAKKMPYNFGKHPFSLDGDLYDTFRTPIEHKFSRKGVYDFCEKNGLRDIKVTRLKESAGWVVWGRKI